MKRVQTLCVLLIRPVCHCVCSSCCVFHHVTDISRDVMHVSVGRAVINVRHKNVCVVCILVVGATE